MSSYQKFLDLCDQRKLTPSSAMIQAGLSKSLATKWKQEKDFTPNSETIAKLCKFFEVTADYFISTANMGYKGSEFDPPDIFEMVKAMRNMTSSQRLEVVHYAKYICPQAFRPERDYDHEMPKLQQRD